MSERWRVGETRIFGLPNRVGRPLFAALLAVAVLAGIVAWLTGALLVILAFIAVAVLLSFAFFATMPVGVIYFSRFGGYDPPGRTGRDERHRR